MCDMNGAIARAESVARRSREDLANFLALNEDVVQLIVYGGLMLAIALALVWLAGKVAGL